ncbi:AAA family ATPase [Paenibacillus sp. LMG 31458]|uniref:AAA family ATPase n=1 Tax=Paenibacillus phytorum TaxID=2654977 RepID=A0ABX1Y5F7_9BACL|nr:TniB family NTP-binding protein [Paenibacillus phytorum]NOU75316.1 AAA family ATPase [Paenibacillus phytorum]
MIQVSNFRPLKGLKPPFEELRNRVEHTKKIIVQHPQYEELLDELKMRFMLSNGSVSPDCLFIYGHTGVGKSTVTTEFTECFPRQLVELSDRKYMKIPVLKVTVPPKATPRSLASKILKIMGDPLHHRGTETELTSRVHHYIEACDVKMIVLDEFQHLIDADTQHVLSTASNWVKTFTEEINIPVVLCGMPESLRIFETNPQLDRRFTNKIELTPFLYRTEAEIVQFRVFLKKIENDLPFYESSNITDRIISDKIYYVTNGIPFYVMQLIVEATTSALLDGSDKILETHLNKAFRKIKQSARKLIANPFEDNKFELSDYLQLEKEKEDFLKQQTNEEKKKKRISKKKL